MGAGKKILLIGAGNMGGALLRGWLDSDIDPELIFVVDPHLTKDMIKTLEAQNIGYGASAPEAMIASVLILAIKPQMMETTLPALIKNVDNQTLVVSIAAGTTIKSISALFENARVVRAMPNTPAMIGRGITGIVSEQKLSIKAQELVEKLLSPCGLIEWLEDEKTIDAVTAVSGSGPAYLFLLVECMANAGIKLGLEPDLAMRLARETIAGAGELMYRCGEGADVLRENVTSLGGTTAAALSVLMENKAMENLFIKAMTAAKQRSEELARIE